MTKKRGTMAAVEAAVAAKPLEFPEEEQLDLIGGGNIEERLKQRAAGSGTRRGRPAGAENRRKQEWASYLLSRYASPLEVLAQMSTARVDDLVIEIGCTKLEALQEKRLAAMALLPYIHQKQAVSVDVTNHKVYSLTLVVENTAPNEEQDSGDEILVLPSIEDKIAEDGDE